MKLVQYTSGEAFYKLFEKKLGEKVEYTISLDRWTTGKICMCINKTPFYVIGEGDQCITQLLTDYEMKEYFSSMDYEIDDIPVDDL